MKKVALSLLAFALVGVMAFADDAPASTFKVSTWSRIGADLWGSNGTTAVLSNYPSWANGSRFGFAADGSSANVTWHLDMNTDGKDATQVGYGGVNVDDQAFVAIKFSDMVSLTLGDREGDVLRGKVDDGGDTNVAGFGADDTFARFHPTKGFLLELTPVPNLYAAASIDVNGINIDANNAWKKIQIGAGYTIEGLGLLRAQYIGAATSATWIQAAFNYTAIENLNIDTGVKISSDSSAQDLFNMGGQYVSGPSTTQATIEAKFAGPSSAKADFGFWFEENYTVDGPLGVGAELSAVSLLATSGRTFDAFPYLYFQYSNAKVQIGLHYVDGLDGQVATYSIPVWVTSSF